jgi:hypothetical protein
MDIMKNFLIISLIALLCSSCKNLMNGQIQPVRLVDSKANIFLTTCSGVAETIGSCHQKARETCKERYRILEEKIDSSGIHREIKFQCE